MDKTQANWELLILDGTPPVTTLANLAAGDIDGDGQVEVLTGGIGGLLWYRPNTLERGKVADGNFGVGIALEDIDGDGLPEVVAGSRHEDNPSMIRWFKPPKDLNEPWTAHAINPDSGGAPHDLVFVDIDGDGETELVANTGAGGTRGISIFKRTEDVTAPWKQYVVQDKYFEEGLCVADLNGDGKLEIVLGPDVYFQPDPGPLAGLWKRWIFAPGFREMNRVALVDITGNGRDDIVIAESEYLEGRMSWFENRLVEDPDNPWVEHRIDGNLYYAHSMQVRRDEQTGEVRVFVAEMAEGGWHAPRNYDARVMEYVTSDKGWTWGREIISRGPGTHEAFFFDVDGDGVEEVLGKQWRPPKFAIWKRRDEASPITRYKHSFIDRDKPETGTDIVPVDVDGDGLVDVACGEWWYKNPTWERYDVPGFEVLNAYDIDADGRNELIAAKHKPNPERWMLGLTSELYWLKPVDPLNGKWEEHSIGTGSGDWPHGIAIGPVGPGGKLALITGYHNAHKGVHPEIFEAPDDPASGTWKKRTLAEIPYGEEFVLCDIDGDGKLDIVAGPWWLENLGNGTFAPHKLVENTPVARVCVADFNGNGRPDILLGAEALDFKEKVSNPSPLMWLENPPDPRKDPWPIHVIDSIRCPHSLGVADLDGDGEVEIVCGEHDPFYPYRARCRTFVYKKADPTGRSWYRYLLDDRFEHHDGCKIIELAPGKLGIISHGWKDNKYVHLWEPS